MSQAAPAEPEALTPEAVCNSYAELVCRFAMYASRDEHEAEDVAQEALIRAIRHLDRYDPHRGSMKTWLWGIVANTARDMARAGARRQALLARLASLSGGRTKTVEEIALDHLGDQDILEAIRRLGPRDRILIGLRFSAGLGVAEIAEVTHSSTGAAGKAIRRALDRLKSQLRVR